MNRNHLIERLNEIKLTKLDEYERLLNKPTLFLSDYFYSIRNEVDIQAETLLLKQNKSSTEIEPPVQSEKPPTRRQIVQNNLNWFDLIDDDSFDDMDDSENDSDEENDLSDDYDYLMSTNEKSNQNEQTINKMRDLILSHLVETENKLIQSLTKAESLMDNLNETERNSSSQIKSFELIIFSLIEKHRNVNLANLKTSLYDLEKEIDSNENLAELEKKLEIYEFELDNLIDQTKQILFQNQTVLFKRGYLNPLGILILLNGVYLKENEIKYFK